MVLCDLFLAQSMQKGSSASSEKHLLLSVKQPYSQSPRVIIGLMKASVPDQTTWLVRPGAGEAKVLGHPSPFLEQSADRTTLFDLAKT